MGGRGGSGGGKGGGGGGGGAGLAPVSGMNKAQLLAEARSLNISRKGGLDSASRAELAQLVNLNRRQHEGYYGAPAQFPQF